MPPTAERPRERVASHYDRHVVPFTRAYTEAMLTPLTGLRLARALDHGAGTGTLTRRLLADHPDVSVVALDPSEAMLERLARGLAEDDRSRVAVVRGTAADLGEAGPFDLVVSQLALMFCEDPERDLGAIRRRTRERGRLVVSVLGGRSDVVAFDRYWTAAAATAHDLAGPDEYPHFRFGDPTLLIEAAARAGWGEVRCAPVAARRELSYADLWSWLSGSLPLRLAGGGPAVVLTPSQRRRLRAALEESTADLRAEGGLLDVPMNGWRIEAVAS